MRTTIRIPDDLFDDLMAITKSDSRTAAIQTAIEQYVRHSKLQRLHALRGKVDVLGTELNDQADIEEQLDHSSS